MRVILKIESDIEQLFLLARYAYEQYFISAWCKERK